jgi:hypothetical protein
MRGTHTQLVFKDSQIFAEYLDITLILNSKLRQSCESGHFRLQCILSAKEFMYSFQRGDIFATNIYSGIESCQCLLEVSFYVIEVLVSHRDPY